MEPIPPELYRRIFESASVGVAISDEQGQVVDANDYLLKTSGWTREEAQNMIASDFYYDGAASRRLIIDKAMRQGGLTGQEVRFKKKDGTSFWTKMNLKQITLDGRRYIVVFITDVDELKEAKRIFSIATKSARIGIWYSDPAQEGKLIWTDETYEIFGFTRGNFDGRVETFFKLVHPEDATAVTQASKDALAGKSRYNVTHRIVRKNDGAARWVHQEAEVTFDADGKPYQMIGTVQDVTDSKMAEELRLVHVEELETVTRMLTGREGKMVALKQRIRDLEQQLGQEHKDMGV